MESAFETVRTILGWSSVINICLLMCWFVIFIFARNWMFRQHRRWFVIPDEKFDAIHYSGMAMYKICIWLFNLAPYLAMRIAGV